MIIFGFQENDVLHIISNVFFFQRICWTAFWYFRSINSNFSCRKVIRIPGENTLCLHCAKSVQIRSYFWSVFSRIRTEYGEILRIWSFFTQWYASAGTFSDGNPKNWILFPSVLRSWIWQVSNGHSPRSWEF